MNNIYIKFSYYDLLKAEHVGVEGGFFDKNVARVSLFFFLS